MPAPSVYTIKVHVFDKLREKAPEDVAKRFQVTARTGDAAAELARKRLDDAGFKVRSLSFSTDQTIIVVVKGAENAI
jgi:hypothetical protein